MVRFRTWCLCRPLAPSSRRDFQSGVLASSESEGVASAGSDVWRQVRKFADLVSQRRVAGCGSKRLLAWLTACRTELRLCISSFVSACDECSESVKRLSCGRAWWQARAWVSSSCARLATR
mmetsp:Transcript_94061/g.251834  ORF Transcript_94061/g.251834 Transcript_94061/m.251834 type:complete len:121 (+) Transcript_94061:242-604(+)